MWILHLLPDSFLIWVVNITCIVGFASAIAGYFFVGIPYIGSRRTLFQILGVALLIAGVYLKGGYSAEMQWRDRVAEVEAKVKVAEEKAKKANTQVQTKIVTKIVKIQEKAMVAKETIRRNKEVINRECKLSDEAISAYNFSITKTKPQEKK